MLLALMASLLGDITLCGMIYASYKAEPMHVLSLKVIIMLEESLTDLRDQTLKFIRKTSSEESTKCSRRVMKIVLQSLTWCFKEPSRSFSKINCK